jgi:hypothetical protein
MAVTKGTTMPKGNMRLGISTGAVASMHRMKRRPFINVAGW